MPRINGIYFTHEAVNHLTDDDWEVKNLTSDTMLKKGCLYYEVRNVCYEKDIKEDQRNRYDFQKHQWKHRQQKKKYRAKEKRLNGVFPGTHIKSQSYQKTAANKRMIRQELILLKRDES